MIATKRVIPWLSHYRKEREEINFLGEIEGCLSLYTPEIIVEFRFVLPEIAEEFEETVFDSASGGYDGEISFSLAIQYNRSMYQEQESTHRMFRGNES